MKILVSLLLIVCLGCQSMARFSIMALYQVNKDYISKNLCENRAKPQMKCNGKCYLRKQLKKAEGAEHNGQQPTKSDKYESLVYCLPVATYTVAQHFTPVLSVHNPLGQHMYNGGLSPSVFHPPSEVC
jgi:hypothetical protein